jgi:Predicted ATPase with chaperone activity
MLCKTYCATCIGIDAVTVTVEVDLSTGIGIHLVGLPDSAVRESLLRVTTALSSYGYKIPGRKIVFNLAPADIRKEGSAYDLAIAMGLIAVSEQALLPRLNEFVLLGELSLDGHIRPVPGALPIAIHARESGFKGCIFPRDSALEAVDLEELEIYGVTKLSEVIDILAGDVDMSNLLVKRGPAARPPRRVLNDFKYVKGQSLARRGLEIAASGGHNLLLVGSPGSGKTMMASCLPSILPPMTREESIETSKIWSIAGHSIGHEGLLTERLSALLIIARASPRWWVVALPHLPGR